MGSVHLRPDEVEQVGAASEAAGMKISTFIESIYNKSPLS